MFTTLKEALFGGHSENKAQAASLIALQVALLFLSCVVSYAVATSNSTDKTQPKPPPPPLKVVSSNDTEWLNQWLADTSKQTPVKETTEPEKVYKPRKLPKLSKQQTRLAFKVEAVGKKYHLPKYYMAATAWIEANLNPKADRCKRFSRNRLHRCKSARGLYQFVQDTGRHYDLVKGTGKHIVDHRMNPTKATQKAALLGEDNKKALVKAGLPTTGEYLYLSHNQGIAGLKLILSVSQGNRRVTYGSKLERKMYKHIQRNSGYNAKRIKRIGKFNKRTAQLFLSYRADRWQFATATVKQVLDSRDIQVASR